MKIYIDSVYKLYYYNNMYATEKTLKNEVKVLRDLILALGKELGAEIIDHYRELEALKQQVSILQSELETIRDQIRNA